MNTDKNILAMMKRFTGAEFKILFIISTLLAKKEFTVRDLHKVCGMSIGSAYKGIKFLIGEGFVEQITFPKTKDVQVVFKSKNLFNMKVYMEKDVYGQEE